MIISKNAQYIEVSYSILNIYEFILQIQAYFNFKLSDLYLVWEKVIKFNNLGGDRFKFLYLDLDQTRFL